MSAPSPSLMNADEIANDLFSYLRSSAGRGREVAIEGATYGMTKSMPLVVPALVEYIGLWRDCRGRVLKSYSALVLRLDAAVVGV